MAMTNDLIVNAMKANYQGDLSTEQENAIISLADAIISTVKQLSIGYTSGLIAPSGGGPVTGTLNTVVIE